MFSIFDAAGSAMAAQSLRLNLVSSNLANANSVASSDGETYRARHAVFEAALNQAQGSDAVGVHVTSVVEDQSPLPRQHQPGHPYADEEGYVTLPNVNAVEEMANMLSASRSYQNNVTVLETAKQLMLRTLQIGN